MQRALFLVYGAFFRYQSWSRRRFTLAGYAVLSGAVLSAALGIDTRYTLAYQSFAFLSALLAVAYVLGLRRPPALRLEMNAPRRAQADTPFLLHFIVGNPGKDAQAGLQIRLETPDPRPDFDSFRRSRNPVRMNRYDRAIGFYRYAHLLHARRNADLATADLPRLPAGGSGSASLEVTPYRRGLLRVRGLSVLRPDPIGLVRASRFVPSEALVVVLPKRYPMPRFSLGGHRLYQPGGVALAASVGESGEFLSLRDYRPGDPLPRIHWRSFARLGKPVVKEYQDEYFERHALILDNFVPEGAERAFEEAVSVAASLACTLDTHDCRLELLVMESRPQRYAAGRGQLSSDALLEVLACLEPARDGSFDALREAALQQRAELSGAVVIILSWNEERRALVEGLRATGMETVGLLVAQKKPADAPAWLRHLEPGKIEQGLAALC